MYDFAGVLIQNIPDFTFACFKILSLAFNLVHWIQEIESIDDDLPGSLDAI